MLSCMLIMLGSLAFLIASLIVHLWLFPRLQLSPKQRKPTLSETLFVKPRW